MNMAILIIVLTTVFIAFVATIVTGIVKAVFFFQYHNVYQFLLRFALIGQLIGIGTSAVLFALMRNRSLFGNDSFTEIILSIPFYTMLIGLACGVITVYKRKNEFKKRLL